MYDMKIIEDFEKTIAEYAGSKYGVAISSCTNAIFLSLLYLKSIGEITLGLVIRVPSRTFMSVPMSIINAGFKVGFVERDWSGLYPLDPTRVWDSATRFTKGMYVKDSLQCLSFQYRKHLPIGRGGMVLTNDKKAVDWLKQARHNGKHPGISKWEDTFEMVGWDMYLTPSDALLGLTLFNRLPKNNKDCCCQDDYPDLSKQEIFK